MAPPLKLIAYRCPRCGWAGQINEADVDNRAYYAKQLRSVGSFKCALDDRMLCPQCAPLPVPGETDLRSWEGMRAYRIEVSHVRSPVKSVLWLDEVALTDLQSTLLGKRDAEYLGPPTAKGKGKGKGKTSKPSLATWWRELRGAIDGDAPDLGHELGMWPRHIDFGTLGTEAVLRPLHLLNPTGRAVVFRLTSNILTSPQSTGPTPPHFPYRLDFTPALEAARRDHDAFEVPARDRLVVGVVAEPWARSESFRRFEIWAETKYLGEIKYVHKP